MSGVTMAGGAFDASIDFGTVQAYGGTLSTGVTRSNVTTSSYTVSTPIDITVGIGGLVSSNYTLQADIASAAPTGLTYRVDSVTLTTSMQTITSTGAYNSAVLHTIGIVISSSAPGSGGPTVGSLLSDTLNFTATSN